MKKVLNVFGIILSVIFSIVLVPVLVATPIVSALSGFTQAETIQEVVASVDYGEIIDTAIMAADPGMADELEDMGISGDAVQDLMETETVGEVLDLYVEDMFSTLDGESSEISFDEDAIQDIISANKEELLPFVKQFTGAQIGEGFTLSDEEAGQVLDVLMEQHGDTIMDMLPTAEDLGIAMPDAAEDTVTTEDDRFADEDSIEEINAFDILQKLHNGSYVKILIIVVAILSVLILLCRWVRFEGFMWIGVVYLISAVLSLLVSLFVKALSPAELFGDSMGGFGLSGSIVPIFVAGINKGTITLAAVGVGAIILFIIGRVILKKTQK